MSRIILAIVAASLLFVTGCCEHSVGVPPDPFELVDIEGITMVDPEYDCLIRFWNIGEWPVEIIAMHFFFQYNPDTQDPDIPVELIPEDENCSMFYDGHTGVLSCGEYLLASVEPGDDFRFNATITGQMVSARLMYVSMDVPDDEDEYVRIFTDLAEEQILCTSNYASP